MIRTNRKRTRTNRPTLPELDQTKRSVLNSLTSLQSRRSYQHAMDEFIEWYCSEPSLQQDCSHTTQNRARTTSVRCLDDQLEIGGDTPAGV